MNACNPSNRQLKILVREWLIGNASEEMPPDLLQQPARRLINPLLSMLYSPEPIEKWRAVTAIGRLVAGLADKDMESARVIMRRLMWSLNDESGGIGWGAPESMGEIMARHQRLAEEFHAILISYLSPDENYLELEALQPGLLWAIGRLARIRPKLMGPTKKFLPPYLASPDTDIRGHAAWAATALDSDILKPVLRSMANDDQVFVLYRDQRLERISIGAIINC